MIPKFRAWHKENKTMHKVENINFSSMTLVLGGYRDADNIYHSSPFYRPFALKDSELDEIILMQSTGLTDRNGKEIFEGDIVSEKYYDGIKEHDFIATVVWDQKEFCLKNGNHLYSFGIFNRDKSRFYKEKIIGNIHENPELLEKSC